MLKSKSILIIKIVATKSNGYRENCRIFIKTRINSAAKGNILDVVTGAITKIKISKDGDKMLSIGLMSGTSLDGVDVALVDIDGFGLNTKVKLLDFLMLPFLPELKARIKQACDREASNVALICSLNVELGEAFLAGCQKILLKNNISASQLDFVASHGQTIWHQPYADDTHRSSTLQIGEGSCIAYALNVPVIENFRVMDMAAGGLGAPLVPYSEYLLYRRTTQLVLLQNIGGIGNVTVIPANARIGDVSAFDTGPGNMMIDEACSELFGEPFDDGGQLAAQGKIISELADELRAHPYLALQPPKTTGREMFGKFFVQDILARYEDSEPHDILFTLTDFTAFTIADSYRRFIFKGEKVAAQIILGGGGAYNRTLITMLQRYLPSCEVVTQEQLGLSSAAKEAIAFAILGNETLHQQASNVPSATGAKEAVVLGKIIPRPR